MKYIHFQNILVGLMVAVTFVACAPASDKKTAGVVTEPDVTTQPEVTYTELKPEEINRECSKDEADTLKNQDAILETLSKAIKKNNAEKDDQIIEAGQDAIMTCDAIIDGLALSAAGACRITVQDVVRPNHPKITYYDQYRVDQKCKETERYLVKFGARPGKNSPPKDPKDTDTDQPTQPPVSGVSRQCTKEEFTKLSQGLDPVNKASVQIDAQGEFAQWRYDKNVIALAALGAKSCESLIAYHDQQPCERTIDNVLKKYNNVTLRQRCEKVRMYFYEFVQNAKTLNFKNADLYLDISKFKEKVFGTDYIYETELCRIENTSGRTIDYTGKNLVLVKDTRGFEHKMMILETQEGLNIQCVGLNIGDRFSKREIVKRLQEKGTNMPLVYKLK